MKDYMADEAVAVLSFDKNTGLIKNVVSCDPENAVSQAKYFRLLGQNARIVRYDDLEFYLERDKNVPFINNTALVVDNIVHGGGYRLLDVDSFLHPLSAEYVDAAITAGAHSLGELDLSSNRWKFKTWKEQMGKYPAGYFTHKVGDDVSAA